MSALSVSAFSMGCGMTYLPVESLKSAFLRSVIFRKPSGVNSPMSPVWNQPSLSMTSSVLSCAL